MIAVDTNLLVYAHRSAVPEHEAARAAILQAAQDPRGWGIALASVAEFWSVVTHPAASGRPSTPAEAQRFMLDLAAAGAELWRPGPNAAHRLLQIATENEVSGSRVFDLQIALTAFDNGATEVWTHDRGFAAFGGLKVRDPLA